MAAETPSRRKHWTCDPEVLQQKFPFTRHLFSSPTFKGSLLPSMNSTRSPFRGGMQVHSVPEQERAIGANGQRLPWAVEYGDPDRSAHLDNREKGPFGRSTRRRTPSRSKTSHGTKKEDKDQIENWKQIDAIFKRAVQDEQSKELARTSSAGPVAGGDSSAVPVDADVKSTPVGTPTEVILYGYAPGFQYTAIEFYERASRGAILEDYDRLPPNPRYSNTLSMRQSQRAPMKLSRDALRKKNTYRGGEHWIKVTFDSAEAAAQACLASPHVLNGYLVHAEMYRGDGPSGGDREIKATPAAILSASQSPSGRSSSTLRPRDASETTSATVTSATVTTHPTTIPDPFMMSGALGREAQSMTSGMAPNSPLPVTNTSITSSMQIQDRPLRIRGARRAVLLPAEEALVPGESAMQRFVKGLPIVGWFVSGSSDIIGEGVPRKEGATGWEFDAEKAGLYWRFWYNIDWWFGTDYCGLKGDD